MTNKTTYNITGECNAIFDSSSNTITGPPKEIEKLNYMLNAVLIPKLNRYTVKPILILKSNYFKVFFSKSN